jgi:3-oxoacyl-[acyl-carrier protein] reductase
MSEFSDKTVLVTGAGRGIGRCIALQFASDGAAVCVNYAHSAGEARALVEEIRAAGGRAIACKADIANSTEVAAMVDQSIEAFGAIDILVNNAGLNSGGPFLDIAEDDWDRVYGVNLKGPFLVSQAVARRMMSGDGGVIVNISATTTIHGRPNAADYCSTKAGLNMLTKCMALELGPKIRVNGIGLGFVDSPLVREVFSEDQLRDVIDTTPLARMTTPEETAAFVKLLASDSAAFVTGQTIMFDGGRVMR